MWKFFFLVTRKTLVTFMTSTVTFVTKGFSNNEDIFIWTFLIKLSQQSLNNKQQSQMKAFELTTFCFVNVNFTFNVILFSNQWLLHYQPSVYGFSIGTDYIKRPRSSYITLFLKISLFQPVFQWIKIIKLSLFQLKENKFSALEMLETIIDF